MMKRLRRWWRSFNGWMDCPNCGEQTLTWEKVPLLHPEEPPLFGFFRCVNPACGVRSQIEASPLMDEAAQKHGYRDFGEFAEERFG